MKEQTRRGVIRDINGPIVTIDLTGVRKATVVAKAWYDIEAGYDYLYAVL